MRNTLIALATGFMLFALTGPPVVAETCSGYYAKCVRTGSCKRPKAMGRPACMSRCTNSRAQCMKTGTWNNEDVKDQKVEKR